jgi:hypothetical protein
MIDQVFDSAMEKKSPLILNHLALVDAIAEGACNGPMGYYDCHGRSALESVITRDSNMGDDDDDDDDDDADDENEEADAEAEETEPRDPPPPSFGSDPTPPSFGSESTPLPKHKKRLLSLRNQRVETTASACEDLLLLPNGLLAKSRAETASSFVMNMLEASKNKNFQNQSSYSSNNSSPSSNKSKKKENQFVITVPIYTGNNTSETDVLPLAGAAAFVKTNTKSQKPKATRKTILAKDDDDDNVIAAAAARWRAAKRAAKERFMVHPSVLAAALSGDCDYDTTADIASATTSADAAAPEESKASTEESKSTAINQKQENARENGDTAEYGGTSTQNNTDDDPSKHRRRKALDPPGSVLHKPEGVSIGSDTMKAASFEDVEDDNEDDLLSEVVESLRRSVIEHSFNNNNNNISYQNQNKNDPDSDLAPLVAKLAKNLKNVEDQHESHRSMLFEQRVRLEKLKTHRKEQQQKATLGSSSLPVLSPLSFDLR